MNILEIIEQSAQYFIQNIGTTLSAIGTLFGSS